MQCTFWSNLSAHGFMHSTKAVLAIVFPYTLLETPLFRFCQDYCSSVLLLGGKSLASQQCNWMLIAGGWKSSKGFQSILQFALSWRYPKESIPWESSLLFGDALVSGELDWEVEGRWGIGLLLWNCSLSSTDLHQAFFAEAFFAPLCVEQHRGARAESKGCLCTKASTFHCS